MKDLFKKLENICGFYEGHGINHEGQPFLGRFALSPVLGGRGFTLRFSAYGKDGTLYHQEESTIAPSISEKLFLWNFNTNTPGLVPHELRSYAVKEGGRCSLVFGYNDSADSNTFREEVVLEVWPEGDISYVYFWGLPGGEFKERSGLRMAKKGGQP